MPELTHWLFNVKRLGATLAQSIPDIKLSCINEYDAYMDEDEAALLNLNKSLSRIRLVKHHCKDKTFVFGRTIIPQKTYLRYQDLFDSLGHNSIGEHFLFKNTNISRSEFYVKECSFEMVKHKLKLNDDFQEKTLWVRASIFTLEKDHKILIEEFFVHRTFDLDKVSAQNKQAIIKNFGGIKGCDGAFSQSGWGNGYSRVFQLNNIPVVSGYSDIEVSEHAHREVSY